MAVDLGLDDEIQAISDITTTGTGFFDNVQTLLMRAFNSTQNPFGSAATRDVGTSDGNVVAVNSAGNIPSSVIPAASESSAGAVRFATNAEATSRASGVSLQPSQVALMVASETQSGVVRKATDSQVSNRSSVNRYVTPNQISSVGGVSPIAISLNGTYITNSPGVTINATATVSDYQILDLALEVRIENSTNRMNRNALVPITSIGTTESAAASFGVYQSGSSVGTLKVRRSGSNLIFFADTGSAGGQCWINFVGLR